MANRPRGKKATIKQRSIDLYLPSVEMAEEWKEMAGERGMSISKFVTQKAPESLAPEGGRAERALKSNLSKELEESREERKRLEEEVAKLGGRPTGPW